MSDETQPWFVVRLDDLFVLGALVTHEAPEAFPPGERFRAESLVYLFGPPFRNVAEASSREVGLADLLIAPQVTNKMGWKRGLFEAIERDFAVPTFAEGHCFYSYPTDQHFDDDGDEVDPAEYEWIIQAGVTYSDAVCQLARNALGLDPDRWDSEP